MVDKYCLNSDTLPTIPTPHDCVIESIDKDGDFLIFKFENGIAIHDSIKHLHPSAETLTIRFHLAEQDCDANYTLYAYEQRKYEAGYIRRKANRLHELAKKEHKLEYLYHSVGYNAIMIKMYSDSEILLDLAADYIEFEWIDS